MKARHALLAAVAAGSGLALASPAAPASATVTVTRAATTITVTVTGDEFVEFDCSPTGGTRVNLVEVTPVLPCADLTQATVNGDAGAQRVYGSGLDGPAFTSSPRLVTALGEGADSVSETAQADSLSTGGGDDSVDLLTTSTANTLVTLGAGTGDRVTVSGNTTAEQISASSPGSNLTLTVVRGAGSPVVQSVSGAESLYLYGGNGNDVLSSAGVAISSTIDFVSLAGQAGDDDLTDGPLGSYLYGGSGTNVLRGGTGGDTYWSESDTDVLIDAEDGNVDYVYDAFGLRSGSRSLTGFGSADSYSVQAHERFVVMRIRPRGDGSTLVTTSLNRTGQQVVPAGIGTILAGQTYVGAVAHRGILDVAATPGNVYGGLPSPYPGLLDVTLPSGATANVTAAGANVTVTPASGAFGTIQVSNVGDHRVHGPWTDKDQGFAHRVHRDLMFAFATDEWRDATRTQLASGARTRSQVVASLMDRDAYRTLDVEQTFVRFLRRWPDPGGTTYWVGSIRGGKALWRFRAQLVGSNEYFTKAGGTNSAYVKKAYNDVLGRDPDPSGAAYWTGKLDDGADRGSVALQFLNSPEARRRLVDDQFLRFLDRKPTTTEQATWVAALPGATGEQDLIAFLAASTAYRNRT